MRQLEVLGRKYSMAEEAKLLGVSRMTVAREIARDKLGCFRIGGRVLIGEQHISDYLELAERSSNAGAAGATSSDIRTGLASTTSAPRSMPHN